MQKDKQSTIFRHPNSSEYRFWNSFYLTRSSRRSYQLRFILMKEFSQSFCCQIFITHSTTFMDSGIVIIRSSHPAGSPTGKMGTSGKHVIVYPRTSAQHAHQTNGLEMTGIRIMLFTQRTSHQRKPAPPAVLSQSRERQADYSSERPSGGHNSVHPTGRHNNCHNRTPEKVPYRCFHDILQSDK